MHDVAIKSTGTLIDELSIINIKSFMAQEEVCALLDPVAIANAAKRAQSLNARRNALIRAIDERLGESERSPTEKTYG